MKNLEEEDDLVDILLFFILAFFFLCFLEFTKVCHQIMTACLNNHKNYCFSIFFTTINYDDENAIKKIILLFLFYFY